MMRVMLYEAAQSMVRSCAARALRGSGALDSLVATATARPSFGVSRVHPVPSIQIIVLQPSECMALRPKRCRCVTNRTWNSCDREFLRNNTWRLRRVRLRACERGADKLPMVTNALDDLFV